MSRENRSENMNDDTLDAIHKAGSLLIIETGEYSDRSWDGPVRLLKDFTKREVIDRFKEEWKPKNEWEETPQPDDRGLYIMARRKLRQL